MEETQDPQLVAVNRWLITPSGTALHYLMMGQLMADGLHYRGHALCGRAARFAVPGNGWESTHPCRNCRKKLRIMQGEKQSNG